MNLGFVVFEDLEANCWAMHSIFYGVLAISLVVGVVAIILFAKRHRKHSNTTITQKLPILLTFLFLLSLAYNAFHLKNLETNRESCYQTLNVPFASYLAVVGFGVLVSAGLITITIIKDRSTTRKPKAKH